MKNEIIKIAKDLEQGIVTTEQAQTLLLCLFSVSGCGFINAKVGDYLRIDKLRQKTKKYTIGKTYEVLKSRKDFMGYGEIAIRDDKGTMTWLNKHWGSKHTFTTLSCR